MVKYFLHNVGFLLLFIGIPLTMLFAFGMYKQHKVPGYYGPAIIDSNGDQQYHTLQQFVLTDQNDQSVSLTDLENTVIVSNFFFASCPSICPQMMVQLQRLGKTFEQEGNLHFLSFTVDPKRDSAAALKAYGEKFGVDSRQWSLLTGDKKTIYKLARNSYFIVANEGDGGPGDFIHSEKLVLSDQLHRIRGYYDGTDSAEVNKLMKDIQYLLK